MTTALELYMTDLALEKSHWKIAVFVMCPVYMCANAWGSLNFQLLVDTHDNGAVYGIEKWKSNPPLTIFMFIIAGFFQGGIFYCACAIVERCWGPKRAAEEFKSLL